LYSESIEQKLLQEKKKSNFLGFEIFEKDQFFKPENDLDKFESWPLKRQPSDHSSEHIEMGIISAFKIKVVYIYINKIFERSHR